MTLVSCFCPHCLQNTPSNHLSYAGTKWLHWMIFSVFCWARAGLGSRLAIPAAAAVAPTPWTKRRRLIGLRSLDMRTSVVTHAALKMDLLILMYARCFRIARPLRDERRDSCRRPAGPSVRVSQRSLDKPHSGRNAPRVRKRWLLLAAAITAQPDAAAPERVPQGNTTGTPAQRTADDRDLEEQIRKELGTV